MDDLVIAAGTPWELSVIDARSDYDWSRNLGEAAISQTRYVIVHHTATAPTRAEDLSAELSFLKHVADTGPYRLPYHFVIMPRTLRVWYVNDVDTARAHTYGYNRHTAIAVASNYQFEEYSSATVLLGVCRRILHLYGALALMWRDQHDLYLIAHRQVGATACPGQYLYDALSPFLARVG